MLSAFVRGAWRKLPVETMVVAIAAAGAIGCIHGLGDVWPLRLMFAGALVTPLTLAAHGLGLRRQGVVVAAVVVAVVAALTAALPRIDAVTDPAFRWPYALALIAALLVPFVAAARRFTGFVRRFFEETTTWGLLYLCALAALAVIGLALHELFDLRIDRFGQDAAVILTAGFVLVYLDRMMADDPATPGRMPELWRRLATAIGAPFVGIMLVILVVYEVVVVVRGELPRNMLSPLILAAGFVGFVSTLILSSVQGDVPVGAITPADPHPWARRPSIRLVRAFPLVLLALLPMAGWALRVRIEDHGITPFRAVRATGLLCLVSLSLVGTLRWLRGLPPLSWQVPAAIAGFALTAAFGPVSAVRLSIASQTDQLARRLDAAGIGRVVRPTPATAPVELDAQAFWDLQGQLEVLYRLGGEPALRRVLSGSVEVCASAWSSQACLAQLGVVQRDQPRDATATFELEVHGTFATEAGAIALIQRLRGWQEPAPQAADVTRAEREHGIVLLPDAVALYVDGKEVARTSLVELMDRRLSDRVLPARWLALTRADGSIAALLAVDRLRVEASVTAAEVTELAGVVLWPR